MIVVLWPAIATPSLTLILGALYGMAGGLGAAQVTTTMLVKTTSVQIPLVLVPAALAFPFAFTGFLAFAVMTGLQWSVGSRGVIGSAMGALGVVAGAGVVLGLCATAAGSDIPGVGPALSCLSPVNLALAAVAPDQVVSASLLDPGSLAPGFAIGTVIAVVVETVVTYAMLAAMRRSFMMTVRRLAGLK